MIKCSSLINLDSVEWNISPGQHELGSNNIFLSTAGYDLSDKPCGNVGIGHEVNPYTGLPYAPNKALRGDFVRCLGFFW